jgi:hypothetical protein
MNQWLQQLVADIINKGNYDYRLEVELKFLS